jgi:hypothetical protein
MQTGVILYLLGEAPMEKNHDIESDIKKLEPTANRVEVVAKDTGHFDIADAWWALTVRGMQHIICMIGEINSAGTLKLQKRRLRLCG